MLGRVLRLAREIFGESCLRPRQKGGHGSHRSRSLGALPLRAALSRLARGRPLSVEEDASVSWSLHPAERSYAQPALHLSGQLDRVVGFDEESSRALEWTRVLGGPREHRATTAHILKNAVVHEGHIYTRRARHSVGPGRPKPWPVVPDRHFSRCALASSATGRKYFGHWLTDDCSRALTRDEVGPFVFAEQPFSPHQRGYAELLDIPLATVRTAAFDELLMLDDVGQNGHKRSRYMRMRARVLDGPRVADGPGVYLRRGPGRARRRLLDEPAIEALLAARGFLIADPSDPFDLLLSKLRGAPLVVGVEGSQLAHALFTLRARGGLLCLQPPDRFNNVLKDVADCIGLRYGFLIGEGTERGFRIDRDELLATIDLFA